MRTPQRAQNGAGYQFPPLWGPDSYNNGAGMSRLLIAAAYAMHNMPIGTAFSAPVLTDEDAYDVAAYVISQKRPEKANLEKDFPVRLQKPVDDRADNARWRALAVARDRARDGLDGCAVLQRQREQHRAVPRYCLDGLA